MKLSLACSADSYARPAGCLALHPLGLGHSRGQSRLISALWHLKWEDGGQTINPRADCTVNIETNGAEEDRAEKAVANAGGAAQKG